MGRLKNGPNGGFSGKVGSVIGYELRGKAYIKGWPKISKKKPSVKQLANRAKFKLLQEWRSYLTPYFAITFKNHTQIHSAQNAAHRFNLGIVKGEYPTYEIDYSKVVISQGNLPMVEGLSMQVDHLPQLNFSWHAEKANGGAYHDLMAIIICYDLRGYIDGSLNIAERGDKQFSFKLTYPKGCLHADIYVTVLANDREKAANSVYMGRVML